MRTDIFSSDFNAKFPEIKLTGIDGALRRS